MGVKVTEGLGAGARASVGAAAAEETIEEIVDHLAGAHMCFITAGMGGGTGTGAAPIIAQAARELGVLTVGVVTKPFQFEGAKRMRQAEDGVEALQKVVDTLIIIPNQNLFRLANEKTTFTEAFALADDVLYQGVKGVTDLMVRPGLINLDFADVRAVMDEMGKAMMGTGEAEGEDRARQAAEKAIANPLLDEISLQRRQGRADQHHRRPRPDAVRTGRGGERDPREGGPGRQHHRRLHARPSTWRGGCACRWWPPASTPRASSTRCRCRADGCRSR
jgi:cell division protein FtsZ